MRAAKLHLLMECAGQCFDRLGDRQLASHNSTRVKTLSWAPHYTVCRGCTYIITHTCLTCLHPFEKLSVLQCIFLQAIGQLVNFVPVWLTLRSISEISGAINALPTVLDRFGRSVLRGCWEQVQPIGFQNRITRKVPANERNCTAVL